MAFECETICETGEEEFSLYPLLPQCIRDCDSAYGGVLKKIVDAISREVQTQADLIEQLRDLVSVDSCPSRFLSYLTSLLGTEMFSDWSEDKKRNFISSILWLYRIKGTRGEIESKLRLIGRSDLSLVELFKSCLHETFDYFKDREYTGIRAARIQYEDATGTRVNLDDELTRDELDFIRSDYPIHVRERLDGKEILIEDEFDSLTDIPTDCESVCESSDQIFMGGIWNESLQEVGDSPTRIYLEGTCNSLSGLQIYVKPWCQESCQQACQIGPACEVSGCETFCQAHCQVMCQWVCQAICQQTCESPCMVTEQF